MLRPFYSNSHLITVFLNRGSKTVSKQTFAPTYFTNPILRQNCDIIDDGIMLRTKDISTQTDPITKHDLEIFFNKQSKKSNKAKETVSSDTGTHGKQDPHDKIGKVKKRFDASQSKFFSFWNKENK